MRTSFLLALLSLQLYSAAIDRQISATVTESLSAPTNSLSVDRKRSSSSGCSKVGGALTSLVPSTGGSSDVLFGDGTFFDFGFSDSSSASLPSSGFSASGAGKSASFSSDSSPLSLSSWASSSTGDWLRSRREDRRLEEGDAQLFASFVSSSLSSVSFGKDPEVEASSTLPPPCPSRFPVEESSSSAVKGSFSPTFSLSASAV
mmetsp:Transcript_11332/g.32689  ORF Transcript_11332/g.32689 Transcript_11332/m.32689 type:complete len:203 (+) Transcript_11332:374-982(+)